MIIKFEKIILIKLKLNNNKLTSLPGFKENKQLKDLVLEVKENFIDNIENFSKEFKNLMSIENF